MSKILADEKPIKCDKCGCRYLKYNGLGEFQCEVCNNVMLNNYGKVRAYLENHENAPISEVMENTGVSEENISSLVEDNRIIAMVDSRFKITCRDCGTQILLGDYCEKCKEARERARSNKIRMMMGEKPTNNTVRKGYSPTTESNSGRIRYRPKRG